MPVIILDANVVVISDKNATAAHVEIEDALGVPIQDATGSSKREQYDVYNESVAVDLAVGRAFQKLGRQMVSRGHKAVKTAMAKREAEKLTTKPIPYTLTEKGRVEGNV